METKGLLKWIKERQRIYELRSIGKAAPWTKDPILQANKFCNVYREQDKTTVWIKDNWRDPHCKHPDLWFAMVVARLFNKPDTLRAIGIPLPWHAHKTTLTLHELREHGAIFSGAYIVSTNGISMDKVDYLVERVLTPLWEARKSIRPRTDDTLQSFYERLVAFNGIGTFIGAQVVADMKYTPQFSACVDWWSFAASGPGSRRGLNRVCQRDPTTAWTEKVWWGTLQELRISVMDDVAAAGLAPLHSQDLQNCLCEFDKYERVRLGQGRMKATYKGGVK
jgi:hypothetical protein